MADKKTMSAEELESELIKRETELAKREADLVAKEAELKAVAEELEAKSDDLESREENFAKNVTVSKSQGYDHLGETPVKVIRIDGLIPRVLTKKGKEYIPARLKQGETPCYTVPTEYAQELLLNFPDKYGLFEPDVLLCRGFTSGGGREEKAIEAKQWAEESQTWN